MNVVDRAWKPSAGGIPAGTKAMVCFLNVAVDPTILDNNPDNTPRLRSLLAELVKSLHDKGTLAIALETTIGHDFLYINREFETCHSVWADLFLRGGDTVTTVVHTPPAMSKHSSSVLIERLFSVQSSELSRIRCGRSS